MNARSIAEECSLGSEQDRLTFPQVLGKLKEGGIEGYFCDLRRNLKTYYLPDGETVDVPLTDLGVPVAEVFDAAAVDKAVRLSQANAHTYRQFLEKIMRGGCSGYLVSLPGWRTVYLGRTGETHIEHFPK